jgi:hypothetical protein
LLGVVVSRGLLGVMSFVGLWPCLVALVCWSAIALGSDDVSLAQALQRIRQQQPTEEVQRLRAELLGSGSVGAPSTSPQVGQSGTLTIVGETPRDKAVSAFVASVLAYRKSVDDAKAEQDRLARQAQQRNSKLRQVRLELASSDGTASWQPVHVDVTLGQDDPITLQSLPMAAKASSPLVLARTALETGEHSVRIRGVASAVEPVGPSSVFAGSLREPMGFDYQGRIKVTATTGSDLPRIQTFRFVLNKTPQGVSVMPHREDSSHAGP